MAAQSVAPCLQDTTELDFNARRATDLGPLSDEAQRAMYLRPTSAVMPQRAPLRVLDAWMSARESRTRKTSAAASSRACAGSKVTSGARIASNLPATRRVDVANREADMTALMGKREFIST
ncbi:hypothetical protein AB870_23950 (plasmid) [Pandoraea faecigallinarum]|uniref:Uncharacterized protein n=1 Tax=Pandoraea faecigallinarum TaxID=656179 RepID=A0A173H054_9BURK|nr:hypothetical protein [Pandoraea faecigallinarum]ANI21826.1 hypothetical protein AB870_23950 [Pandoraea faecigallinarum]